MKFNDGEYWQQVGIFTFENERGVIRDSKHCRERQLTFDRVREIKKKDQVKVKGSKAAECFEVDYKRGTTEYGVSRVTITGKPVPANNIPIAKAWPVEIKKPYGPYKRGKMAA